MNPHAEFIVGCRSCGNYCVAVERVRSVEVPGEVVYSDGYIAGWKGVQTEVVTCPHCGLVMSWRKNCQSADVLRQTGDLRRFKIPQASWGPPPLYWTGFKRYDAEFHPAKSAPTSGPLPRLTAPPASASLWALRKRAALARGLLWLDNDRQRLDTYFGILPPKAPRSANEERRRARLLRALLEGALFGGDDSEANALDVAEWFRELGEWEDADQALDRDFESPLLADRARQLRELVAARIARVVPWEELPPPEETADSTVPMTLTEPAALELPEFDFTAAPIPAPAPVTPAPTRPAASPEASPPPAPEPAPEPEAVQAPEPATVAPPAARARPRAETKSPRMLLDTLLEVLGTLPAETLTRDYIPRPYGALVRGVMKSHNWDEDSFAVSFIRGFARQHGWPEDADPAAIEQLEAFGVDDEELLDYLAAAFKKASWDQWAFEVPTIPAPKRGG